MDRSPWRGFTASVPVALVCKYLLLGEDPWPLMLSTPSRKPRVGPSTTTTSLVHR